MTTPLLTRYVLTALLAMAAGGADGSPKPGKPKIGKAAAHANAPGEADDTLDITLDDNTVITDTPMNIIKRVQAGEFALPVDAAETVADKHNAAVLDPAKDTGNAELVDPEDLTTAPDAAPKPLDTAAPAVPPAETTTGSENDEPPAPAAGTASVTNTDTSLTSPVIAEAPGPSTQADSSTTVSGQPVITDDNPVVGLERTESVKTAATPADVTAIAPAPDAGASTTAANTIPNASPADQVANPTPVENIMAPRAQAGSDVPLTGEKAAEQIAPSEPSTWTPSAALNPQEPTTLAEHAQAEALKTAASAPGAGSIEDRLKALEDRMVTIETHYDGVDVDLDHIEERLTKLEPGVS